MSATPDPLTLVLRSVDGLGEEMDRRFTEVNEKIDAVKKDTSATNGRVRKLELWKARMDGFRSAFRWAETAAAAGVGAVLTAVAAHLIH